MEVYPAPQPNGTAVVVAPGGGFSILAIEHEGRDVARWLNQRGVTAFVLRYRCGLEAGETPAMNRQLSQKAAIEDGLLAVKTVRERAAEWKLDPRRIGVMGFSAGGYLTIGVATQYTAESRPDFAIPIYAVAPEGYQPPADAPPLFVAVAFDDNGADDHNRHGPRGQVEEGKGPGRAAHLPRRRPRLRHEQEGQVLRCLDRSARSMDAAHGPDPEVIEIGVRLQLPQFRRQISVMVSV